MKSFTPTGISFGQNKAFFASLITFIILASPLTPLAQTSKTRRLQSKSRISDSPRSIPQEKIQGQSAAPQSKPLISSGIAAAAAAPAITATKTDSFPDTDGDGKAQAGETITYTVTVANNGTADALGVAFNDAPDANTTLIGGSISTTPLAFNDLYTALGNVRITKNAASGLLANDTDPDTESNAGLSISALGNDTVAPFTGTGTQGGDVVLNADGSFSYNPPAGFVGADAFTYTVMDQTGKTDSASVTITVSPVTNGGTNVIWFIDNSKAAGGDGRISSPFNCLVGTNTAAQTCFSNTPLDETNDIIFVAQGSGAYNDSAALGLLNGQVLIGQGVALASVLGITPPPDSDAFPAATANPVINSTGDGITLAQNNTIRGLTVGNTSGTDITGTNFGTLTTSFVTLNGNGRALGLATGALNAGFNDIAAASTGANEGLRLEGISSGALSVTGSTNIQNSSGIGIHLSSANNFTANFGATTINKNSTAGTGAEIVNSGSTTFTSLAVTTSNGIGLSSQSGTHNVGGGSISATGNAALVVSSAAMNMTFTSLASTNSTAQGINLNAASGTLASGSTNIQGAAGSGISVTSSTGAPNFGNTTVNSSAIAGAGNTGVTLTGNSGNISFADLDITPKSGQRALHATLNTGTLTATSGTISAPNVTAVEIVGASSGNRTPLSLTFDQVSASNTARGIVIQNTSAAGALVGFRILGSGTTDGSGGTVSNISARGVELIDASEITLRNMTFTNVGTANGADPTISTSTCGGLRAGTNTGCNAGLHMQGATDVTLDNVDMNGGNQIGINGNNVTNFSLANSRIENFGDQVVEDGIQFQNLHGTSSVTDCTVTGNESRQIEVQNNTNNGAQSVLTVSRTTLSNSVAPNGEDGILFSGENTANMKVTISESTFRSLRSSGVFSDFIGSATGETNINTSAFNPCCPGGPIQIVKGGAANVRYNISDNPTFLGAGSNIININKQTTSTSGTIQGTINGNSIGNGSSTQSATSAGTGIRLVSTGDGTMTAAVTNNTIMGVREHGILASIQENAAATNPNPLLNVTITNNTINATDPLALNGIQVNGGATSVGGNDKGTICANISGNTVASTSTNIRLRQRFATTIQLPGYTGANTDNTAVQNYLAGRNTASTYSATNTTSTVPPGGGFVNGGTGCAQPAASATLSADDLDNPAQEAESAAPTTATATPAASNFRISAPQVVSVNRTTTATTDVMRATATSTGVKTPQTEAAQSPVVAPQQAGSFPVQIGTLPAGKSVTITFQATIRDDLPQSVTQVSNQGTVSGSNFSNVPTDDPGANGASDPTVTPILPRPTISINNASLAEPAAGVAPMPFTVTLSTAFGSAVTVNYTTADGTATGGDDYTATSGTLTFNPGETVQTVSVNILADGNTSEANETFAVTLNTPVNGFLSATPQATGTITVNNPAGTVLISELRTSGPNGANDDFVELYNNTDASIDIGDWSIVKSGASCSTTPVIIATIPAGTTLPARGHYLVTGSAYSISSVPGNLLLSVAQDIEDDRNVALFNTANPALLSTATRMDAIGFGTNTGNNCDLLREGTNLPAAGGSTSQYSFVRIIRIMTTGLTTDTNDNAANFQLVSTTPATPVGSNATPVLGAPGPENLASHIVRNATIKARLLAPTLASSVDPNRVRNGTGNSGTLSFRRTLTNNTGQPITSFRFRVNDLSTLGNEVNTSSAQLALTDGVSFTYDPDNNPNTDNTSVLSTTLEAPSATSPGGGLNTSLRVNLPQAIAPGATFSINITFNIVRAGNYRFSLNHEALLEESAPAAFSSAGGKSAISR